VTAVILMAYKQFKHRRVHKFVEHSFKLS